MLNKILIGALVIPLLAGLIGQAVSAAGPAVVNLATAGNFVILAKTGISTTGATSIVGNLGLSPAAASYITGFALTLPAASAFSTSAQVTGNVYAPGYANPTPANLTTAVLDMQNAYTDAMGRAPGTTELGAGNIGGMTLAPGVYKWSTNLTIPTDVTLSGGTNDTWIFQIAQNLTMSSATHIVLSGGAQASNIFWVVAGQTTIGTTAVFNGNILDQTTIVLSTGAQLNGRALAQAAVTLDSNTVTVPNSATVVGYTPPTVTATTTTATQTPITSTSSGVVCTMEAILCPDGSYVSRQAPTCAFAACPAVIPATGTQTTTPSATSNNTSLQTQLNGLLATLHSLQAQQSALQGSSASVSSLGQQIKAIINDLNTGSRSNNVSVLQQFLIAQNKGPAAQSLATHGTTTYFGGLTRAALIEFQKSVGITPASGYFGKLTRAYINSLSQ